jgi:hypothetical protein
MHPKSREWYDLLILKRDVRNPKNTLWMGE